MNDLERLQTWLLLYISGCLALLVVNQNISEDSKDKLTVELQNAKETFDLLSKNSFFK